MVDVDTVKAFMNGFGGGVVVGIVAIPVAKYCLERFGGPIWQDIKKGAYKIWDIVKSTLKFK